MSFSLDNITEMSKESDPLPIVELKPFVHKVWRREKSLPSFYGRPEAAGSSQTNTTAVKDATPSADVSTESPQPSQTSVTPGATPPPKLVHFYVNQFNDFKAQKEHINKLVGESEFRSKSRLHPHVDTRTKKHKQHSESLIPGFITREDRTKSTLNEITEDESSSKSFSCLNKALKPEDYIKQQEIKVSGQRIDPDTGKKQFEILSPFRQLYLAAWHGAGIRHGSPASMLYHNWSKNDRLNTRVKSPLYDHLDRKGTLPSLTINAKSLRRRSPYLGDDMRSEDYNDYRDAFKDTYKPDTRHNVGGIKNSFKVLSKHGQPTKVERQLSFELEINLSRIRKSKDYLPFEITDKYSDKLYPTPVYTMTHGETQLRQGLDSNSSKKRRKVKSRGPVFPSQSPLRALVDTQYMQGMLKSKNDIEHIDSFDQTLEMHDYNHINFDRNMSHFDRDQGVRTSTTMTEEELRFGTPRSLIESRLTMKPTEGTIEETQEEDVSARAHATNNAKIPNQQAEPVTETSPTISTSVSLDEHSRNNSREEQNNRNVVPDTNNLNTGLGTAKIKDKTFLTTGTPGSVPVSG